MTANRRIILNFVATYGRSLYALVCGLFTSRWVLMALGEVDYGLFGLVGGLTAFVVFFNNLLSTSVSRYYAYAVGAATVVRQGGLEECRQWFNLALLLHITVPILLVLLGYPLGEYAVRHWLTIPADRVTASIWVFRFAVLSCFFSMASVPFNAMYIAKQYIAELTIYSFVTTTLNVCFLYFMVTHPGNWLAGYAGWTALLAAVPQVIISVRALCIFPECRFNRCYLWNARKLKSLLVFSGHRFAGALAIMLQGQGMAILVNKMLGAPRNAAMTVGNSLAAQSETLAAALFGALSPAITQAVGAGDMALARGLSLRACRFGTVMVLIFVIPLLAEADTVLRLWLKHPPELASVLCVYALLVLVLEKISAGLFMMIFACGRIAAYQIWIGLLGVFAVPLAWVLLRSGLDLEGIGIALLISKGLCVIVRLYFADAHGGIAWREWTRSVLLPLAWVSIASAGAGFGVRMTMESSFLRVCLTTASVNAVFLPLIWVCVLQPGERRFLWEKGLAVYKRMRGA